MCIFEKFKKLLCSNEKSENYKLGQLSTDDQKKLHPPNKHKIKKYNSRPHISLTIIPRILFNINKIEPEYDSNPNIPLVRKNTLYNRRLSLPTLRDINNDFKENCTTNKSERLLTTSKSSSELVRPRSLNRSSSIYDTGFVRNIVG